MSFLTRCTFAIISHPDAGKTTMTEKLLWFGHVVREAGMVKSKSGNFATSDWLELEKERGISVSTSVMSFPYNERAMHLLDTPGHKDFSEDTYRTLTAVESVLMMIDSAKGVETQTKKLMEVCRMRDTPIVTFMNKFDRDAMDPFELIENVEENCSIQCVPRTWPIGDGVEFVGVFHIASKTIQIFEENADPESPTIIDASDLDSAELKEKISETLINKLKDDLEMVEELMPKLNQDEFLAGIQTPVYFGSALHNFGVKEILDEFSVHAPGPLKKKVLLPPYTPDAEVQTIEPSDKNFSGFVFKIQANMDKNHRDRVAFLRVCSGTFTRGQKIFHVRSEKEIKIPTPLMFQARSRDIVEEAKAGDIIGLYDTGKYQIGDTFTEGKKFRFTGIPSFAPELFNRIELKEPLKAKQLDKGLSQLSEEGAVQLFRKYNGSEKILGAVGKLQFDVVKFRLEEEYNVKGAYSGVALSAMRWLLFESDKDQDEFMKNYAPHIWHDHKNRVCFGVRSDWDLKLAIEKNPGVKFFKNSDYIE